MTTSPLRFGVIGCGAISTLYQIPALRPQRRAHLAAVADRDEAWAKRVGKKFGAPNAVGDFRDLLDKVDAVLVATPNSSHRDITCACLEAGVHVLCEKPAATTASDVESMLETARKTSARLMIGHCVRFNPHMSLVKKLLDNGLLAGDLAFRGLLGGSYASSAHRTDFRRDPQLAGGGVVLDLGVHLIDLAVWFFGQSCRLKASDLSVPEDWSVEADAELCLEFDGASAYIASSYSRPLANTVRITAANGWAEGHMYRPLELELYSADSAICRRDGVQQLQLDGRSMYELQFEHFCSAILDDREFLVQGEQVLATARIVDECYAQRAARLEACAS